MQEQYWGAAQKSTRLWIKREMHQGITQVGVYLVLIDVDVDWQMLILMGKYTYYIHKVWVSVQSTKGPLNR